MQANVHYIERLRALQLRARRAAPPCRRRAPRARPRPAPRSSAARRARAAPRLEERGGRRGTRKDHARSASSASLCVGGAWKGSLSFYVLGGAERSLSCCVVGARKDPSRAASSAHGRIPLVLRRRRTGGSLSCCVTAPRSRPLLLFGGAARRFGGGGGFGGGGVRARRVASDRETDGEMAWRPPGTHSLVCLPIALSRRHRDRSGSAGPSECVVAP